MWDIIKQYALYAFIIAIICFGVWEMVGEVKIIIFGKKVTSKVAGRRTVRRSMGKGAASWKQYRFMVNGKAYWAKKDYARERKDGKIENLYFNPQKKICDIVNSVHIDLVIWSVIVISLVKMLLKEWF